MHTYSSQKAHDKNSCNEKHSRQARLHAGIIGARGYSGMELGRGLLQHPYVEKITLGINETQIQTKHWVPEAAHREIQAVPVQQLIENASSLDVVFLATPAEVSMELAPALLKAGTKVIDVSGAFRLNNPQNYPKWYGFEHQSPEHLNKARYGLTPFHMKQETESENSEDCSLIANPGCYATAIQMALIPLLQENLLKPSSIVIDAKSGTTGTGKKASEAQLFAEVEGECLPYKVGRHQHFPEICEHIEKLTKQSIDPIFSTTLIPVRRGIIAGIYAQLNTGVGLHEVEAAFQKSFENYPLVRFGRADLADGPALLSLKKVVGSARTHIAYTIDGSKLYLYSSIDNLMKGAATQAIENMNYLWRWPLHTGLLHREGLI